MTKDAGGHVYCAKPFEDWTSFCNMAASLADECNLRMQNAETISARHANMHTRRSLDVVSAMNSEAAEARAERNTWALLDLMARSNLLKDIDEAESYRQFQDVLAATDPSASLRDVVNKALDSDEAFKRLQVVQVGEHVAR